MMSKDANRVPSFDCVRCWQEWSGEHPAESLGSRIMQLCPSCRNKRCPRASDHRLACTGSNEPGQEGSIYACTPAQTPPVTESVELLPCPFCEGKTSTDRYGPDETDPEMGINCEGECEGIFIFPKVAAGDWQGLRRLWNAHRLASYEAGRAEGVRAAEQQRREVQAVWRCAFGDVAGVLDILKNKWLTSRRKHKREAGSQLAALADAIWANRDPAPTNYNEAAESGKGLHARVKAALSKEPAK